MKVVIDTNVLLTTVFPNSKNHWIQNALVSGELTLCVTTDILDEYAEIFERFYDAKTAELLFSVLEILPNILQINKYYFWRLIPEDPDDEKFVDCAIAAGADFLVTNDKHFNKLKQLDFPKINVVNEVEFKSVFENYLDSNRS